MDKSELAAGIFSKLAEHYQQRFMDVSIYEKTFDHFCNHINISNPEVLELACGPGNISRSLLAQRPQMRLTGLDLAPEMIRLAKINNPQAEFFVMDCRKIGQLNREYDAVMCGFLLPYLCKEEVQQLIADTSNLLKAKGIIYISTMEDDYDKSDWRTGSSGDKMYMHYYNEEFLVNSLKKNNFKILNVERVISTMTDNTSVTDLILIAGK
jgi:ubiquinone/menaquinone biosynthesis C-methylase UbiE